MQNQNQNQKFKYFVWIRTNGRYDAQIWDLDFDDTIETRMGKTVFKHEILEDEKDFKLDDFIIKYPAPNSE